MWTKNMLLLKRMDEKASESAACEFPHSGTVFIRKAVRFYTCEDITQM